MIQIVNIALHTASHWIAICSKVCDLFACVNLQFVFIWTSKVEYSVRLYIHCSWCTIQTFAENWDRSDWYWLAHCWNIESNNQRKTNSRRIFFTVFIFSALHLRRSQESKDAAWACTKRCSGHLLTISNCKLKRNIRHRNSAVSNKQNELEKEKAKQQQRLIKQTYIKFIIDFGHR